MCGWILVPRVGEMCFENPNVKTVSLKRKPLLLMPHLKMWTAVTMSLEALNVQLCKTVTMVLTLSQLQLWTAVAMVLMFSQIQRCKSVTMSMSSQLEQLSVTGVTNGFHIFIPSTVQNSHSCIDVVTFINVNRRQRTRGLNRCHNSTDVAITLMDTTRGGNWHKGTDVATVTNVNRCRNGASVFVKNFYRYSYQ